MVNKIAVELSHSMDSAEADFITYEILKDVNKYCAAHNLSSSNRSDVRTAIGKVLLKRLNGMEAIVNIAS